MATLEYIDATGIILPDTEDLLTTVENEYRVALGADLNTDPATPQGRLIATEVDARDTFLRNLTAVANQINPRVAEGVFLDAIMRLTGDSRYPETKTTVAGVELGGVPGTVIPVGSQAQMPTGDVFETLTEVTLDGVGVATVDFAAVVGGPITCPAGQLNLPVTAILGWESVSNPEDGTPGRNVESDVAARLRRLETLALQGVALPEAIMSGVRIVDGVRSLAFRENVTALPAVIDGVNMKPHSIFVCVDGGSDDAVAAAILAKKSLGADFNGATTVYVIESASTQVYPVQFDRPAEVQIKARVTVRVGTSIASPQDIVRAAIVAYANGEIEGEQGFVVGGDVSPFELSAAVNTSSPGIFVTLLEVAKLADAFGTATVPISIQEVARISASNIQVITL